MGRLFTAVSCVFCVFVVAANSSSAGVIDLSSALTDADSVFELSGYDFSAPRAFDGSLSTRWASAAASGASHWIEVDLGADYTLSAVNIAWDASNAYHYQIGLRTDTDGFSSDFSTYTPIVTLTDHTPYDTPHSEFDDFFDFSTGTASFVAGTIALVSNMATAPVGRYLMIHSTLSPSVLSINEVQVSGTATPEPSALVLLGAGVISLLAYAWRKRR